MCNFERTMFFRKSRDDGIEVTLLPIPNRTVKVYSADGTARVTVWQSRTLRGNIKKIVIITIFFCRKLRRYIEMISIVILIYLLFYVLMIEKILKCKENCRIFSCRSGGPGPTDVALSKDCLGRPTM